MKGEKDLTIIEKEIHPIVAKAETQTIKSASDMQKAVELLSTVNKQLDKIVAEKEKVTKPLNEALKAERGRWKPFETILESAISTLRSRISAYQTEQTRLAAIEAEKVASRIKPGKGNLSVEKGIEKLGEINTPTKAVATSSGSVKFREDKKLKITDLKKLQGYAVRTQDWSFFDLNESELLKQLKEGKTIPGAEIEIIQTPVNSR